MLQKTSLVAKEVLVKHFFTDKCTIRNTQSVTDKATGITSFQNVVVCENEPCRLSYATTKASALDVDITTASQGVRLFLDAQIEVKEGSTIEITRGNETTAYKSSGVPNKYDTYLQEISLEVVKRA